MRPAKCIFAVIASLNLMRIAGSMSPAPAAEQAGKGSTPDMIRTTKSGAWSDAATWETGKVPAAGARVQIRTGHAVAYDLKSEQVIRSIPVAGTLTFARHKDTTLDVGLIKIQPGDDAS